ncbi:MAG: acyl-CoA dehydrogenase family protein [Spirosomataceae bacterium]
MNTIFSTPRLAELLPAIHTFVQNELIPLESNETLFGSFRALEPTLHGLREKVKQAGWWGLALPKSLGGHGLTLCEFGQISECLAQSPFGHFVFNTQAPDIGNMELLHHHASDLLKEKYLNPLIQGQIRSCFSMTEPEFAGSNPVEMGTTAIVDGDDYVINGHKWYTSSADGAAFAIVMAVTNPEALPHQRASQILVPLDTPGFELVRNIPVMGHAGDSWASHAEVRYTNVRVPLSYRIGEGGSGFRLAQERLGPGRIHHCMRFVGIAERSFDLMCQYALKREVRTGQKLADMQMIQSFIAKSRAEIDAARLYVLNTAHTIDQQGVTAARHQISAIKFYAANAMLQVVDRAIQVHGGAGLVGDNVLAYWYAHERASRIYDGADEVHQASLAKSILKKYQAK